jgi:hypothetical protein
MLFITHQITRGLQADEETEYDVGAKNECKTSMANGIPLPPFTPAFKAFSVNRRGWLTACTP